MIDLALPAATSTWLLLAEFTAIAGSQERVAELVVSLTQDVLGEPGCLRFESFTRRDDPSSWMVFEEYLDEAAFNDHLGRTHSVEFNSAVAEHIEGGTSVLTVLMKPVPRLATL